MLCRLQCRPTVCVPTYVHVFMSWSNKAPSAFQMLLACMKKKLAFFAQRAGRTMQVTHMYICTYVHTKGHCILCQMPALIYVGSLCLPGVVQTLPFRSCFNGMSTYVQTVHDACVCLCLESTRLPVPSRFCWQRLCEKRKWHSLPNACVELCSLCLHGVVQTMCVCMYGIFCAIRVLNWAVSAFQMLLQWNVYKCANCVWCVCVCLCLEATRLPVPSRFCWQRLCEKRKWHSLPTCTLNKAGNMHM